MSCNPVKSVAGLGPYQKEPCADHDLVAMAGMEVDSLNLHSSSQPIAHRRVAMMASDGVSSAQLESMRQSLVSLGARVEIMSLRSDSITASDGSMILVDCPSRKSSSLIFDAVYVPGGVDSVNSLKQNPDAVQFLREMHDQGKAMAAMGEGVELLAHVGIQVSDDNNAACPGIVVGNDVDSIQWTSELFVKAIVKDRHWRRVESTSVPVPVPVPVPLPIH